MFFFKNHAENKAGRLVQDLFLFFEKASKQVVSILVLIYIGRPPLDNCMSFHCLVTFISADVRSYVYCNICFLVCDTKNFEVNLSFLWPEKLGQKSKYLVNKKSF